MLNYTNKINEKNTNYCGMFEHTSTQTMQLPVL